MMFVRCVLLAIVAVFACSCGRNKNPHRAPSKPFQILDEYYRLSDLVLGASFRHEGDSVSLEGEVEIDRENKRIRFRVSYLTSQELESGARLAMQCYGLDGELLVRNLPRVAFENTDSGEWRIAFDKVYAFEEMGIGSDRESILIQFNYVQEGEYWYDIKFPEIELPSMVLRNIVSPERYRTLIAPIPLIAPIGFDCFYPAVIAVRNANDREFDYAASMEVISLPDRTRKEEERRELGSAAHLGGDYRLLVAKVRLDEYGRSQMRHGFVWDGVKWYDNSEDLSDYRTILAVPSWVYFGTLLLTFGLLSWAWGNAVRLEKLLVRRVLRVSIALAGLYLIYISMISVIFWILAASGTAFVIAGLRVPFNVRLYAITFFLFALLEVYWGWICTPWIVFRSGILLSICIHALLLAPILWIRNSVASILLAIVATLCLGSVYILMSLYASFFNDYPSLRVIGYADQVFKLSDSVWSLMVDSHFLSLAIVAWYWGCLLKAHWADRRSLYRNN